MNPQTVRQKFGLDRPVIDQTGISGKFDVTLDFADPAKADAPSITTAVQDQLGLKLKPDGSALMFSTYFKALLGRCASQAARLRMNIRSVTERLGKENQNGAWYKFLQSGQFSL